MARQHPLLVAASVAALLGALLASPSVAQAGTEPDGPTYQMPTVGECHQVTNAEYQTMAVPTEAVDCATEHTAQVTAVAVLPADTDWSPGSADLRRASNKYCMPGWYQAIDRPFKTSSKTAFVWRYWLPNAEQRSHGASWIRCDLILPGLLQLLPLPSPLLTGSTVPENLQICLFVAGGTVYISSCGDQYNWHNDRVFTVPGKKFPKRLVFVNFADSHCKQGKPWRALWVTKEMWKYGDHTLTCFREATPPV